MLFTYVYRAQCSVCILNTRNRNCKIGFQNNTKHLSCFLQVFILHLDIHLIDHSNFILINNCEILVLECTCLNQILSKTYNQKYIVHQLLDPIMMFINQHTFKKNNEKKIPSHSFAPKY